MSKPEKFKNAEESMGGGAAASPAPSSLTRKEAPPERQGVKVDTEAVVIEIEKIKPDPDQPRKEFDADEIKNLGASMARYGQIQPIRVRWHAEDKVWLVVSGERRYRAAIDAGLPTLKAHKVENVDLDEVRRLQLVENLLRQDLKGIEQANAFHALMVKHGWTAADLSREFHVTKSMVSRALALLDLAPAVQEKVRDKSISPTTAVEIAKINDPEKQAEVAERAVAENLTVPEVKELVEEVKQDDAPAREKKPGAKGGTARGSKVQSKKSGHKAEWSFKAEGRYTITVANKKGVDPAKLADVLREALLAAEVQSGKLQPA